MRSPNSFFDKSPFRRDAAPFLPLWDPILKQPAPVSGPDATCSRIVWYRVPTRSALVLYAPSGPDAILSRVPGPALVSLLLGFRRALFLSPIPTRSRIQCFLGSRRALLLIGFYLLPYRMLPRVPFALLSGPDATCFAPSGFDVPFSCIGSRTCSRIVCFLGRCFRAFVYKASSRRGAVRSAAS